MSVFDFSDYKAFVVDRIRLQPQGRRGEYRRLAKHLNMHPTSISQVFKGEKDLNADQALDLCGYFGFTDLETEYFLLLVQMERAGSVRLKDFYRKKAKEVAAKAQQLTHRLDKHLDLSDEHRARFYSSWHYSAIRLLTDIPGFQTTEAIAQKLGIPRALTQDMLNFLVSVGLCLEHDGKYRMGPRRTHLDAKSPFIARHHTNWRLKALENVHTISHENELFFTSPMTLSRKGVEAVRAALVDTIAQAIKISTESESEVLHVLNMDWVEIK